MQFLDEETRSDYFKAAGTLQAVLSIFDHMIKEHGHELELITVDKRKAHCGLHDCPPDIAKILVQELNQRFRRLDEKQTAQWLDEELGILLVKVTHPHRFRYIL